MQTHRWNLITCWQIDLKCDIEVEEEILLSLRGSSFVCQFTPFRHSIEAFLMIHDVTRIFYNIFPQQFRLCFSLQPVVNSNEKTLAVMSAIISSTRKRERNNMREAKQKVGFWWTRTSGADKSISELSRSSQRNSLNLKTRMCRSSIIPMAVFIWQEKIKF